MSLYKEVRKKELLRILNEKKKISVQELIKALDVSGATVRSDLETLEQEGFLRRVYGGAVAKEKLEYEFPFQQKLERNVDEKKAIARKALSIVEDNDILFLDSGTTVLELAKILTGFRNLRVVTISLPVSLELASVAGIELFAIGGKVNSKHLACCDSSTLRYLHEFHFDKAFLGTDGISVERGLSTNGIEIAEVDRIVVQQSRECIVLADSSKIGSVGFARTFSLVEDVSVLVTDWHIERHQLKKLRDKGVNVEVAHREKALERVSL